jgi:hypothetical protein
VSAGHVGRVASRELLADDERRSVILDREACLPGGAKIPAAAVVPDAENALERVVYRVRDGGNLFNRDCQRERA